MMMMEINKDIKNNNNSNVATKNSDSDSLDGSIDLASFLNVERSEEGSVIFDKDDNDKDDNNMNSSDDVSVTTSVLSPSALQSLCAGALPPLQPALVTSARTAS
jgi:hypothetical protein